MSLDTLYRPKTYADVLGQRETIQVLKQYVATGSGFHQSYLFAGAFGSGKTTIGRILARSLLCSAPVDGEPCDKCSSCIAILDGGSSMDFYEVDAATNSGKDSVRKIVDEIQYSTFSGKRRLYLFDESHALTAGALDALLKPLEDNYPGSQDKQLVCIFCTTEPEKMRSTVLSRCAPAFVIRPVSPEQVGERLALICGKEGIPFEQPALNLIGEITECHIRDALKAVEGVSMMGGVTVANVRSYLHLDYSDKVLSVLTDLPTDLSKALLTAEDLLKTMSPITVYEKLATMGMLAYRSTLGPVSVPTYIDRGVVEAVGKAVGIRLLDYVEQLASRPGRPTPSMLLCDLAQLHHGPRETHVKILDPKPQTVKMVGSVINPHDKPTIEDSVYVHPRAVNHKDKSEVKAQPANPSYSPLEFFQFVKRRVGELAQQDRLTLGGQTGRDNVVNGGVDQGGGATGH